MGLLRISGLRGGVSTLVTLGVMIVCPPRPVVGEVDDAPITRLAWLAGCWESTAGDRRTEEHWMAPGGGMMLGMSRTVVKEIAREFEQMRIHQKDGRLVFTAHPSGQAEDSFDATELTSSRVVFENPAHDFPQRIIYARAQDGSLLARIEGVKGGEPRGVDFPMRRAACGTGSGGQP